MQSELSIRSRFAYPKSIPPPSTLQSIHLLLHDHMIQEMLAFLLAVGGQFWFVSTSQGGPVHLASSWFQNGHLWQFWLTGHEGLIGRYCRDSHPFPGSCFIWMKCLMRLHPLLLSLLRGGNLRQREHVEDGRIKWGSSVVHDDTAELIDLLAWELLTSGLLVRWDNKFLG